MKTRVFSLRFPKDILDRIEDRAGSRGRNAFILGVVETALEEPKVVNSKPESIQTQTVASPRMADRAALLALYRRQPMTSRDAEGKLDWLGLRFKNAENGLLSDRSIRFEGGLVHAL